MRTNRSSLLLALAALLGGASSARADGPFPPNYGLASPLLASGSSLQVSYYGWENTTLYGHTLWAMSSSDYISNLGSACFAWSGGGSCSGTGMFTKAYGVAPNPYLALPTPTAPLTYDLTWANGTEVIFALQVHMRNPQLSPSITEQMWFFSGAPSRNADQLAHVAYFGTGGVAGNGGVGIIPGTVGLNAFGFEDVYYSSSDWDFDNSIFTVDNVSPPTEIVPEPATLTLIGSGLIGLAAARKRRRLSPDA